MDNKDYFERVYKTNYDCALKYVQQKNWPEARASLEKAGEAILKIIPMAYGPEKDRYVSKAKSIRELLQEVKSREGSKPVTGGHNGNNGGNNGGNNYNNNSNYNNGNNNYNGGYNNGNYNNNGGYYNGNR